MQYAHLGQAVEAFFRNGGRRCWVVRVADRVQAQTNRFALPGLIRADNGQPALAQARSAGSWSDGLRVGTVCVGEAVRVVRLAGVTDARNELIMGEYALDLDVGQGQVGVGDVLQLSLGATTGPLLLVHVMAVQAVSAGCNRCGDGGSGSCASLSRA